MRRYVFALCLLLQSASAFSQGAPVILPAGDSAVAGFSGTYVLGLPPEARRLDKTYINLDGPALRVIDLSRMSGPPQAQLVAAPKPFTATAGQIGQVFALALDDASPPNIYAAATSAYGLPIVVPDTDGDGRPDRSRRGATNAAFMPGLFGPVTTNGGPGWIWKINGVTGAVTLFANVSLAGVPNSGPALGGLAFDRGSRQLFAADRDTGMIHRFTLDGVDRGHFDHGTQALTSAGLPAIAFDPRKRLNIESPAFDSGNPATWAYAPAARRVFGLAVTRGRLYYAVAAGLRIWSVSLLPDGSFGADARVEVAVPRGAAAPGAEISEVLFDDNGDMLVAERGAPTGAYDYNALAEAGENRVLRFRPKLPSDPPSRDLWFPVPKEYAIGFPPDYRNDNGGIAIGYGYDQAGNINRAVCGGTLWSTGEQLRNARDPAIVRRLQPGGPLVVNGLQGNSTRLLRPLNEPPFEAYYIDYDDRFEDPQTRGHMGDVVIWRVCGQAALPLPIALPIVCPVGWFDVDGICQAGLACPPGTEFSGGCCTYRGCPSSYVRIGGRCVPPPMNCGEGETYANGRCEAPKCPAGLVPVKGATNSNGNAPINAPPSIGGPNAALNGLPTGGDRNCPPGTTRSNDQCQPVRDQPKMCGGGTYCKCPEGTQVSEDGTCVTECPKERSHQGGCCLPGSIWDGRRCVPPCPDGSVRVNGQCPTPEYCPDGSVPVNGQCPPKYCPDGSVPVNGQCPPKYCPDGSVPVNGQCPQTPKLKITKTFKGCCLSGKVIPGVQGLITANCSFTISVTNIGTATYSGPIEWRDWSLMDGLDMGHSTGGTPQQTLAPGQTISYGDNKNAIFAPGTKFLNCAVLAPRDFQQIGTPGPDISCVAGETIGNACPVGQNGGAPPPPPPPPSSSGCPDGSPRNSDGNCPTPPRYCPDGSVPVNGQCPNPPPPQLGCPPGTVPINDGTSCSSGGNPQICQRPKIMSDGVCVCPAGTVGNDCHKPVQCDSDQRMNDAGKCVERRKTPKKRRHPKPSQPSERTIQSPPIELNIGIGIGGGGHPGGHPSPRPMPIPRGGG